MKDQWAAPNPNTRVELPKPESVALMGSVVGSEAKIVLVGPPADVLKKRGVQDCSAGQQEAKISIKAEDLEK